jgi:hypothetical protein
MSAKKWRFSASEINRVIDTVRARGLKITSVNISKDGQISLGTDDRDEPKATTEPEELRSQL